jgi:DNA primase
VAGQLLEIRPNSVRLIPNGLNERRILLSRSEAFRPLNFIELNADEVKSVLETLEELLIKNLACSPDNRTFVTAWGLCFPFGDSVKTRPILRLEGDSGSGKSTAMELLSSVISGCDQKSFNSAAAMYSEGSKVPLLFLDNIERRNLHGDTLDFLLTSVTGVSKKKRKMGTDTEIITERVRCLVCTSGIENIFGWELINRTYVVDFDRQKYGTPFTDEVFASILRERDKMMSALCVLYSVLLEKMKDGTWAKYQEMIRTRYPGHSKDRTNAYLALMLVFADEFNVATARPKESIRLVESWIKSQETASTETGIDSDNIVQYLEQLRNVVRRFWVTDDHAPWPYAISCPKKRSDGVTTFECLAIELHSTFKEIFKGTTPPYAFKDARQLGKRLSDSRRILERAGWSVKPIRKQNSRAVWEITNVPPKPGTRDEEGD